MGRAQAYPPLAAISLNAPCGGEAWPSEFSPQQAIVPSWRSPQVKCSPADIWRKAVPAGTSRLPCPWWSRPQQRAAPFSRRPQAWVLPTVICVKATSAGARVGCRDGVGVGGKGAVGVGIATLGGAGAAGRRVGCAGAGSGGGDGKGACVGVAGKGVGWGGGGWAQATARARQRAAQAGRAVAGKRAMRRASRAIGVISAWCVRFMRRWSMVRFVSLDYTRIDAWGIIWRGWIECAGGAIFVKK